MSVTVECPTCTQKYNVENDKLGSEMKCQKCFALFTCETNPRSLPAEMPKPPSGHVTRSADVDMSPGPSVSAYLMGWVNAAIGGISLLVLLAKMGTPEGPSWGHAVFTLAALSASALLFGVYQIGYILHCVNGPRGQSDRKD